MRDPERMERILGKLAVAWDAVPDMRLGQLLVNLGATPAPTPLFEVEDDDLEALIDRHLATGLWSGQHPS
ncbi:hypothetical protein [Miltoncostaea oceani]|uniref:hypothetical protein n=1 Tax=Miltoncostaea oceani TaxID=2843216 RepID=UPI001C3E80ED|nr:hypothetical protein [Miltoncostaea oceani]